MGEVSVANRKAAHVEKNGNLGGDGVAVFQHSVWIWRLHETAGVARPRW